MLRYLAFPLRFSVFYGALAVLFSLLTWGRAEPTDYVPPVEPDSGLSLHMVEHAVLGALVALPSQSVPLILAGAAAPVVLDLDHAGSALGLPMSARGGHSVPFAMTAALVMGALARRGLLGTGDVAPVLVSALAGASVVGHAGLDALAYGRLFPVWAPFSMTRVEVARPVGVGLLLAALLLVWAARWVATRGGPRRETERTGAMRR